MFDGMNGMRIIFFWKDFNWNDNGSIWCEKMYEDKDQQKELYDLTIRENI